MELKIALRPLRIELKIDRFVLLYALGGGSLTAAVLTYIAHNVV